MSALNHVPWPHTPELWVSAPAHLAGDAATGLTPSGTPVGCGRLHLGQQRAVLDGHARVGLIPGFATAAWVGSPTVNPPHPGRLAYRGEASIDAGGRLFVDFRVRHWLAVAD